MHHVCHTAFPTHGLEHVPKSDSLIRRQILLITNQVPDAGHGTQFAFFGLIVTVAHADYEDGSLRKGFLEMLHRCLHARNVLVVIPPTLRSHIQSVLQDYQIVRALFVELTHHPHGNRTEGEAGAATQ